MLPVYVTGLCVCVRARLVGSDSISISPTFRLSLLFLSLQLPWKLKLRILCNVLTVKKRSQCGDNGGKNASRRKGCQSFKVCTVSNNRPLTPFATALICGGRALVCSVWWELIRWVTLINEITTYQTLRNTMFVLL